MNRLALFALIAALPAASVFAEGSAMDQLRAQAGDTPAQAPAPVAKPKAILPPRPEDMPNYDDDTAPLPPADIPVPSGTQPMLACSMSLRYRETDDQFLILRLGKHIDGTAIITCPDRRIALRLHGDGFAPGLQIPNRTPFQSVNGVVAGNIELRLPSFFEPKQLEGTYHSIGGELMGVGGSFSPWVNDDASLSLTIYLPTTLNVSVGFDISKLQLTLM